MTTETTTTSGLPPLVPFTEQHAALPLRQLDASSRWVRPCTCGADYAPDGARSAHVADQALARHHRDAAKLTAEQCRVLRGAEMHPLGRLSILTTLTTLKPLVARGLIEPAPLQPGENAEPYRITGRGRGVLAEHRRRFA